MQPNTTITGYSRVLDGPAGVDPRGGHNRETVAVAIPIPARVEALSSFARANLQIAADANARRVMVTDAALWAIGVVPKNHDRVTVQDQLGPRVMEIVAAEPPVGVHAGSLRNWKLVLVECAADVGAGDGT